MHLRRIIIPAGFALVNSFGECNLEHFTESVGCYELTPEWPVYSSGAKYEIWKSVCYGGRFSVKRAAGDDVIQGIPVVVSRWNRQCKQVIDIVESRKYVESLNKYVNEYTTYFSSETTYEIDEGRSPVYVLNKTKDVFFSDGVVELFREDGSLRYRGKLVIDSRVATSGDCFDKAGAKPTRHTNNADTCK